MEITAEGRANLQLGCLVINEAGGRTGILFVVNPDIWVTDWLQVSSGNEAALHFGCWLITSKDGVWRACHLAPRLSGACSIVSVSVNYMHIGEHIGEFLGYCWFDHTHRLL